MRIVRPFSVGDGNITACSIPEPDASVGEVEFIPNNYDIIPIPYNKALSVSESSGYILARTERAASDPTVFTVNVYSATDGSPVSYFFKTVAHNNKYSCIGGGRTDGKCAFIYQIKTAFSGFNVDDIVVQRHTIAGTNGYPESDGWNYNITTNYAGLFTDISAAFYAGTDLLVVGASESYNSGYALLTINDAGVGTATELKTIDGAIKITGLCNFGGVFTLLGYDGVDIVSVAYASGIFSAPTNTQRFEVKYSTSSNYAGLANISGEPYTLIKDTLEVIKIELSPLNVQYGYNTGDEVVKSSTHRRYRATKTTADDPETGVLLVPPSWIDVGPTNKWAAFDVKPSTLTSGTSSVTYSFNMGRFTQSLCGFGISGVTSINVVATDSIDGEVYNNTFIMQDSSAVVDWLTYFTAPITSKSEFYLTDLPAYFDLDIDVTFIGSNVNIGALILGDVNIIGQALYGTEYSSNPLTIRNEDGFGGYDIIRRGVADNINYRVGFDKASFSTVKNLLKSIDGIYCVFIGDVSNDAGLTVYGLLNPFSVPISTPTQNEMQFEVLGVL